jgi:hypothetical protein
MRATNAARSDCKPSQIRYAAPARLIPRKTGSDANSTATNPTLVASAQIS